MKHPNLSAAILAAAVWMVPACRMDMRPPQIIEQTVPAESRQVLKEGTRPSILFSRMMDEESVERALYLLGPAGKLQGSWQWKERAVSFLPAVEFAPAAAYRMELRGEVLDYRGGSHYPNFSLPFYVQEGPGEGPAVLSIEPEGGSSIEDPLLPLTIRFSSPMETASVAAALLLRPETEFSCRWNADSTVCTISPLPPGWIGPASYELMIEKSARDIEGRKLSAAFRRVFFVSASPAVLPPPQFSTLRIEWPEPFPVADAGLSIIEEGESFAMSFDRPVDRDSIEYAFSLEPFCPGELYWSSDSLCLFLLDPGSSFEAGKSYHIGLSREAAAADGGRLAEEVSAAFEAAAGPRLLSIDGLPEDGFPLFPPLESPLGISPSGSLGSYSFIWHFTAPIESESERTALQDTLRISPLFPYDLPYPTVVHQLWIDSSRLMSQIEGLGAGAAGRTCYYRLTLPAGAEEDTVVLEVLP